MDGKRLFGPGLFGPGLFGAGSFGAQDRLVRLIVGVNFVQTHAGSRALYCGVAEQFLFNSAIMGHSNSDKVSAKRALNKLSSFQAKLCQTNEFCRRFLFY